MPKKSLEQILIRFSDDMADAREGECVDEIYDKAIQTIKNYYLAKLPKKKNQQPDGTYLNYGTADIFNNGYNQAIDDMNKAIEAE